MVRNGYMVAKKIDFQSGGYIFSFDDGLIFENIGSIFDNYNYIDSDRKILKVSINVDNEIEIEEIISTRKLTIEFLKSYNPYLLEFLLKAEELNTNRVSALIRR